MQRLTVRDPWVVNGIIVRRAEKGYRVTNKNRHGIVLPLGQALKSVDLDERVKAFKIEEIKRVSLMASRALGDHFAKQRIFGVDIGMTKDGSLYIFELNRWPGVKGFRELQNQTQINRIMAYKRGLVHRSLI